jgi:UDP-hydrolysing UDP-N-acetyl-D-glucosamine 2-epimerase
MNMRRVCVFTGSRADYHPLSALLGSVRDEPNVELQLLVSGSHLVESEGATSRQIRADGFSIDASVDMVLAGDSTIAVAKSLGLGVIGYADALSRLRPEILVVLGDRYEALAAAMTALAQRIPVVHIGGGQLTRGAIDDSIRHAITKLASLHFVSTEEFRRRVMQMGEDPEKVFTVGALGLDVVMSAVLKTKKDLFGDLALTERRHLFAVTYHPATADPDGSASGLEAMLSALENFRDSNIVFTGTNVDAGGNSANRAILEFAIKNKDRARLVHSLGQPRYSSLMKHADVIIGNSSSGLIEAPALGTPTVNIGSRQDGRPRAQSVIDVENSSEAIITALYKALSAEHREKSRNARSPYGDGRAAARIARILVEFPIENAMAAKRFVDIPYRRGCAGSVRP